MSHAPSDTHGSYGHVSSMATLLSVFGALITLTVLTVAVAYVDLGEASLVIALAIATVKATLVALYFMHLRYDSGFNRLAFLASFFFVLLFVGITLMDTEENEPMEVWQEHVLTTPETTPEK